MNLWVTYEPDDYCLCWMNAACSHGWTWDEGRECPHEDHIAEDVHESLADAVRDLFSVYGANAVGRLIRERYNAVGRLIRERYNAEAGNARYATRTVYVMPSGRDAWTCDHDAVGGQSPRWIIERKELRQRSRPGDKFRALMDDYRGR